MSQKHSERLAVLLDDLVDFLRGYVVMQAAQADAAILWSAHSHALDAFETTPFLAITSPEKQCGKTRTLDVLELVVARSWRTIMPSEAVLYRKIDAVSPTLMLDEADAIFDRSNGSTEPLRALLNASNRRGTSVPRCVGPSQQLVDFTIFCAKALAGIGDFLPETVRDRSILLRLERKRFDEKARRFRLREAREVAEPLAVELASWAQDALGELEVARPRMPDVLDDRAEEAWEPLFAIAELAGGHWPERAWQAALELSASREAEDEALGTWLLRDVRAVYTARGVDRLSSADLGASLNELEESPWGDIRGKELNARSLAQRLRRYSIRPRTIRLGDGSTPKGYLLEQFQDALSRYGGVSERHTDTSRMDTSFAAVSETPDAGSRESPELPSVNKCGDVAAGNTEPPEGDLDPANAVAIDIDDIERLADLARSLQRGGEW